MKLREILRFRGTGKYRHYSGLQATNNEGK